MLYLGKKNHYDFVITEIGGTVGESKPTDASYILEQAISMKPFFGKRGGITFSGGEPTVQAEALVPLFRELKKEGLHICVDSNGAVWNKHVEELFSLADLILLDVKEINPAQHEKITERSNEQTLRPAAQARYSLRLAAEVVMPVGKLWNGVTCRTVASVRCSASARMPSSDIGSSSQTAPLAA